jgi:hypothetical protein
MTMCLTVGRFSKVASVLNVPSPEMVAKDKVRGAGKDGKMDTPIAIFLRFTGGFGVEKIALEMYG